MSIARLYQIAPLPPSPAAPPSWASFDEAAKKYDGGYGTHNLTFEVMEPDGLIRRLTQKEMDAFKSFAPTYGDLSSYLMSI